MTLLARYFPWISSCLRYFHQSLTAGGKALVGGTLFTFLNMTSFDLRFSPLFWLFLTILVVSAVINLVASPKIDCRISLPRRVRCDSEFQLDVVLSNVGRFAAFDLTVTIEDAPDSWQIDHVAQIATIPANERKTLRFQVQANRRGAFTWPKIRVSSTFPFNLIRRSRVQSEVGELLVIPRSVDLQSSTLFGETDSNGWYSRNVSGVSLEFLGNREYRSGMSVVRWDYRAWARLGQPVVQEFCDVRDQRVGIVLDNFNQTDGIGLHQSFEAAVSFVAAMIEKLQQAETSIDWLNAGANTEFLADMNPMDRTEVIWEMLARVQMERVSRSESFLKWVDTEREPPDLVIIVSGSDSDRLDMINHATRGISIAIRLFWICEEEKKKLTDTKAACEFVSVAELESGSVALS